MIRHFLLGLILVALMATPADAKIVRLRAPLVAFQHLHPCPSTGRTTGACPGFQKDHRLSLECGGADAVLNLQWLSVADHKAKTKLDNKGCRMIKGAVGSVDRR